MPAPGVFARVSSQAPIWILALAAAYLLVMLASPLRHCFKDGFRAIQRYQSLWLTLGALGFSYALFQLGIRTYLHQVLPAAERPVFVWARQAWRDPAYWLSGSPESLWYLPKAKWEAALSSSLLPTFEGLSGLFNNLVSTFPLSAVAAVLLLINWQGHHGVLRRALGKRFGAWSWAVHVAVVLCALAAFTKPLLYAAPAWLQGHGGPSWATFWFQWAPVLAWLSFVFEYLFGVCIQIYLLLLAYVWIRGLGFTHRRLLDVAIRRFSHVVKWAAIVILLSTLCLDLPLILKNFAPYAAWFPEEALLGSRLAMARAILAGVLIVAAPLQITLTFHSETLRQAFTDHLRFFRTHLFGFLGFSFVAGFHFWVLSVCDQCVRIGLGEGTGLWVTWTLVFPWLAGGVSAWLLASWVCFFRRADPHLPQTHWIQF